MSELEHSNVDEAALREWLSASTELADALGEVADSVAADATRRVEARARSKGLGYKTRVKVVPGRGEDNPMTAVVSAPVGAFLGTNTGLRHQTRAWGNPVDAWHPAAHYDLRDSANESALWTDTPIWSG